MKELIHEKMGQVDLVRINRPEVLNSLNKSLLTHLLQLINELERSKIRALILTGEGSKAFIAGADIKEMQQMSQLEMLAFSKLGQDLANALENASFFTIAAINGYALGGGLEMALACDFIYASKTAKLGLPEVKLGIIPGFGGTQRLSRAIGSRAAKELILTGQQITAEEAHNLKLINKICEPENLIQDSIVVAKKIIPNPFVATSQAKKAINASGQSGLREGLELERNMFAVCAATEESKKLISNFVAKKV